MKQQINEWFAANGDLTLRLDYQLDENSIVFDLGGYVGDWTSRIWEKYKCNIFVFEPIPHLSEQIKNKFLSNEKIKVFNFGLSNETKKLNINYSEDGSSFHSNAGKQIIECQIKSICDFISENKIEKIDLIKINTEGDEFETLKSLIENNMIEIFTDIQVQFHNFIPDAENLRNRLQEKLLKTHKLTYNFDFVWENWQKNKLNG